jgi:hypothetical protein
VVALLKGQWHEIFGFKFLIYPNPGGYINRFNQLQLGVINDSQATNRRQERELPALWRTGSYIISLLAVQYIQKQHHKQVVATLLD